MRVLLANHTAEWSGAEVALLELVRRLRVEHDVVVACPPRGPLPDAVAAAGVPVVALPAVRLSLRLGALRTPAGMAALGAAGLALARVVRQVVPDVLHANTLRAGLMAGVGAPLGGPPVVVRAHEAPPPTPLGRAVRRSLARTSAAVVAVSDHTARAFDEGLRAPMATRVYNAIDTERFDPARVAPAPLREALGLAPGARLLGQVAQITPWKGQDTAIRALAGLRDRGVDAHLVLVGQVRFAGRGVRFDNPAYLAELHRLAGELRVADRVHFLGQRDDVPAVLRALELSLVPSWEEPFGLVTVESMAMGVPPLVTGVGGSAELVDDGATGRILPPHDPAAWAAAAAGLLETPPVVAEMGARGHRAAQAFHPGRHAAEMLAVYARAMDGRTGAPPGPNGVT